MCAPQGRADACGAPADTSRAKPTSIDCKVVRSCHPPAKPAGGAPGDTPKAKAKTKSGADASRSGEVGGGEEGGRAAVAGGLFEGEADLDDGGFGPGAAEEGEADGEAEDVAGGDVDVGIAGDGGER